MRTRCYGFSARRTLAAAQKLYEEHKAITYPRTNSRYLTGDLVAEIKPTAALVGHNAQYGRAAEYVTSLERLPLQRVVNDKKVDGPPRDHPHPVRARPLADGRRTSSRSTTSSPSASSPIFHPEAVFERTRVETTVEEHVFRTSGRRLIEPGWKSVYGEEASAGARRRRLGRRPAPAQARAGRER